jgi:hypothetical protein
MNNQEILPPLPTPAEVPDTAAPGNPLETEVPDAAAPGNPLETMEQYWQAIPEHWKDDHRHKVFIGHCLKHGLAREALRKYSTLLAEHPEYYLLKRYQQQLIALLFFNPAFQTQVESPARILLGLLYSGFFIGMILIVTGLYSPFWYCAIPGFFLCGFIIWYLYQRKRKIYFRKNG